jgi:hypothetical protein
LPIQVRPPPHPNLIPQQSLPARACSWGEALLPIQVRPPPHPNLIPQQFLRPELARGGRLCCRFKITRGLPPKLDSATIPPGACRGGLVAQSSVPSQPPSQLDSATILPGSGSGVGKAAEWRAPCLPRACHARVPPDPRLQPIGGSAGTAIPGDGRSATRARQRGGSNERPAGARCCCGRAGRRRCGHPHPRCRRLPHPRRHPRSRGAAEGPASSLLIDDKVHRGACRGRRSTSRCPLIRSATPSPRCTRRCCTGRAVFPIARMRFWPSRSRSRRCAGAARR